MHPMGCCDEVIHLSNAAFGGSDTLATSTALVAVIKKIGTYDLVLCGKQATDGDTATIKKEMDCGYEIVKDQSAQGASEHWQQNFLTPGF